MRLLPGINDGSVVSKDIVRKLVRLDVEVASLHEINEIP